MTKIQRIAKITGKPEGTVSTILNSKRNSHRYSEETRRIVLDADAELKSKASAAGHKALRTMRKRWATEAAQRFIRQTINPNFVDPRLER